MPNWVYNNLTMSKRVWDEIKSDEKGQEFDFDKIVPMPEVLKNTVAGSDEIDGIVAYFSRIENDTDANSLFVKHEKLIKSLNMFYSASTVEAVLERVSASKADELEKLVELGKKCVELYDEYGVCDWYNWSCEFWGTKWNACEVEVVEEDKDTVSIYYETAWSPADGVMKALFEKYPNENFFGRCEEEGHNFPTYEWEFVNGEYCEYEVEDEDDEDDEDEEE